MIPLAGVPVGGRSAELRISFVPAWTNKRGQVIIKLLSEQLIYFLECVCVYLGDLGHESFIISKKTLLQVQDCSAQGQSVRNL